jgi:two-component system nitrate/nitrite sensor histidine kinase NarX
MVSLVSLSIVTMFSSVFISDMAEHDAATINLSGSLRMQAYRLVSETDKITANVDEFDQTLLDNIMLSGFVRGDRSQTDSRYQVVLDRWQRVIKPSITNRTTQVAEISSFVEDIEWLVQAYQREAEQKIEWLRIIQLAALFLTLTLVYFSLHSVHHNIALPLREFAQMARKIGAGDFTHRAIQLLYDTAKKLNENKTRSQ